MNYTNRQIFALRVPGTDGWLTLWKQEPFTREDLETFSRPGELSVLYLGSFHRVMRQAMQESVPPRSKGNYDTRY